MVVSGLHGLIFPDVCVQCGDSLNFGDEGIVWIGHKSITICGECAPGLAAGIARDASCLASFQNISQRDADFFQIAADDAFYWREIINSNS